MKKITVILSGIILLFHFLVYSGFSRNNSDSLSVAKYYYTCMKQGEWPLVYQVYDKENFDYAKILENYVKLRLDLITGIQLASIPMADNRAYICARLIYKNGLSITSGMEMEKSGRDWIVKRVEYNK